MKTFWLFQKSPEGLGRKKKGIFWLWNAGLLLASSLCLGGVSLLFAYGSYDPAIFYDYFEYPLILLLNIAPVVVMELALWCLTGRCALSFFLTGSRNISYDMVCRAMHETGVNLNHRFRETSEGGLAKLYDRRKRK